MKSLSFLLLMCAPAVAQNTSLTQTPEPVMGEAIHCEKGIFMSDNSSYLDVLLESDTGLVIFHKVIKDKGVELYLPPIKAVKTYQDPTRIVLNDSNNGADNATKMKIVLKFKKLIDNETIAYTGEIETDKKEIGGMNCTIRPVQIP